MASLYDKLFPTKSFTFTDSLRSKNNFETLPKPNTFYGPDLTQNFKLTKPIKSSVLCELKTLLTELPIPIYYWWARKQSLHVIKFRPIFTRRRVPNLFLNVDVYNPTKARMPKSCAFLAITHLTRQNVKKTALFLIAARFLWSQWLHKRNVSATCKSKRNMATFN